MGEYSVCRLSESNYLQWSTEIECLAIEKDLWEAIEGSENVSETTCRKAKALLVRHLQPVHYPLVKQHPDPHGLWSALKSLYADVSPAARLKLRASLMELKLLPTESVHTYMARARTICSQLAAANDTVSETDAVICVLHGLPAEYETIRTVLEASKEPLTLASVEPQLQRKEEQLRATISNSDDRVLVTSAAYQQQGQRKRQQPPRRQQPQRKQRYCWFCKSPTHLQRDCKAYKEAQQKLQQHDTTPRVKAATEGPVIALGNLDSSMRSNWMNKSDGVTWAVDSGASRHVTGDISLLHDVEPCHLKVQIGDGRLLEAGCRGRVHLSTSLGGSAEQVSISNVLFVPGCAFNLLSVSQMCEKNVAFEFCPQRCLMSIDTRLFGIGHAVGGTYMWDTVPLRPEKPPSLAATTVSATRQGQQPADCTPAMTAHDTELWHRRYAHLGYRDLAILQKSNMVTGMADSMDFQRRGHAANPAFTASSTERAELPQSL